MTTVSTCLGRNDEWSLDTDDYRNFYLCRSNNQRHKRVGVRISHKEIVTCNKLLFNYITIETVMIQHTCILVYF